MRKLGVLLILFVIASPVKAQKQEVKIRATVEALYNAMVIADTAAMDRLVSPAVVYVHSNGNAEDKREFIRRIKTGASDFVKIALSDESLSVTGKTAIVRHRLKAETNDNGMPGTVDLRIMQVWQKKGGKWRLIGRQSQRVG